MALVHTPGAADANSYSSRAAALARAVIDPRGTTFLELEDGDKQDALLAMATLDIDAALLGSGRLASTSASADQSLVLPFTGETVIRHPAVIATQLLAFYYAEQQSIGAIGVPVPAAGDIKEETVGPITTVRFSPAEMGGAAVSTALDGLPAYVRGYLEPFLRQFAYAWGQGIVRRKS